MYIVTIKNGTESVRIHDREQKLSSGSIVKGINTIDSFTFTVLPSNIGFNLIHDFTTLVEVYNTNKNRYEFFGRVLCSTPSMSESGLISKQVTCESYFGFLCDSQQTYEVEGNRTIRQLLDRIITTHNGQMESYKRFTLGVVNNDTKNIYCGIQRENTWDTIKKKLLDTEGGEIRFRVADGTIYLDYLKQVGSTKETEIALSKNMKSITKEKDPSAFVTRLIPLGAKIKDSAGNDTEQRIDITSVNDGKLYIDDAQAIAEYGLHVGYVLFDDVTLPIHVFEKGHEWLKNNNKVLIKYAITALDLSLLGLDIDDFEVHNYYPVKNRLLGIDDVARITKKTIDICEEVKTTIEIGESFKTLTDIQKEQYSSLSKVNADISEIKRDYATNEKLAAVNKNLSEEVTKTQSIISQSEEEIILAVSGGTISREDYDTFLEAAEASFALKVGVDENDRIVSMLNASAQIINIKSNRLTISSDNFSLTADGKITAKAGKIAEWDIGSSLRGSYRDSGLGSDGIEWYANTITELARPVSPSTRIISVTCDKQKGIDGDATHSMFEPMYITADGEFCSNEILYQADGEPYVLDGQHMYGISIKNGRLKLKTPVYEYVNGTPKYCLFRFTLADTGKQYGFFVQNSYISVEEMPSNSRIGEQP